MDEETKGNNDDIEQKTREAMLYSIGKICDHELIKQKQKRQQDEGEADEDALLPEMSKESFAILTELVFHQAALVAKDLRFFAQHAGRKGINCDDVLLSARRNPSLVRSTASLD